MIDLKILRQQVELGASPARIVELVEQMLAEEAERQRDRKRRNQKDRRARKREQRSEILPVTGFTNTSEAGFTPPMSPASLPPSPPPVTVRSERNGSDLNFLIKETKTCKENDFPDLKSRFSSPVTVTSINDTVSCHGETSNLSLSSIPCQNTLFPLVELGKEERKKESTKERKKEERDRVLVVVRKEESKNLSAPARAREATAGQDKALEFGGSGESGPTLQPTERPPSVVRTTRESAGSLGKPEVAPGPPKIRTKQRTEIVDDWQLSEAGLEFAKREGLSPAAARLEAFRFADHARATARLCAGDRGWEAAWRNWIRSPYRVRQAPAEQPFDVRRHIV